MHSCFEIVVIDMSVKPADGTSSQTFIDVHPDGIDAVDDFLGRFGRNTFDFFGSVATTCEENGHWPWAFVCFEKEFRLAGHLISLRRNRWDFSFSAYSIKPGESCIGENRVPPVGFILVYSKKALEYYAEQSPLFKNAWDQLAEYREDRRWICFPESPSDEWVEMASRDDDQLFWASLGRQT